MRDAGEAETRQYTVQYEDSGGNTFVETFNLSPAGEKEFKNVKVGTWKVIKVGPVSA